MEASPGLRRASEPESDVDDELDSSSTSASLDSTVVESDGTRPFSVSFAPEGNLPLPPLFAPSAPLAEPTFDSFRTEARLRPGSLTFAASDIFGQGRSALDALGESDRPSRNTRSRINLYQRL